MVMQIQVQIGDTRRAFYESPGSVRIYKKKTTFCEIPKRRFMDFGLLYENDEGENM